MKKYVKPELFYEVYELSQHIADCTLEWVNSVDAAGCKVVPDTTKIPFLTEDFTIFADYNTCVILRDDIEDFCYQNSTLNATLFAS